jgi:hypothetical protein
MELDENAREAVQELGEAINSAISQSERVAWAIDALRELGYEPNLSLKLEIGLYEIAREKETDEADGDITLDLTDEDLRTLRGMRISIE